MSKVSVIVPVYNSSKYLKNVIRSLMVQIYKDCEFIFVDDGSVDNSGEIIRNLAEKDRRIKYIFQKNNGVSAARNTGLAVATGKYVTFMDSDDLVYADFVDSHVKMMSEYKHSISAGYYITIDGKSTKTKLISDEKLRLMKAPAVWLRMFDLEALRKHQLSFGNYKIGEDLNFSGKMQLLYPEFGRTIIPTYHYFIRPGSLVGSSDESQFELLKAVSDLEDFAKANDLYEQNEAELEFMVINHILMAGMKRAGEGNMLEEAIDRIIDYVYTAHPKWYQNQYIDKYTDGNEKAYLQAVQDMDIEAIKKFASHY